VNQVYVTVGICVRNCEDTIEEVITSVDDQDFPHELMELIIVDDGSTDNTLEHIKRFASRIDIRTKVYHQNWKGLGATRNVVVQNACGPYIIWVDGDMKLPRDHVRKQVEFMDNNPEVGAAKARYRLLNSRKIVAMLENSRAFCLRPESSKIVGTGGSIYRVKAIREIGGFDERISGAGEDIDALLRMRKMRWLLSAAEAEFYERFKENWKDLWLEYYWWGYGAHYVWHKHKHAFSVATRLPPVSFLTGFARFLFAFRLYRKFIYLLLPLQSIFKDAAWFFGFIRGHGDGYGHEIE
jgi:glycosyltransferase involved in cell wall biosynthesis